MKIGKIRIFISLFFVVISMFLSPLYVEAKTNLYLNQMATKVMEPPTTNENTNVCESDAILGNVNCTDSVAWLLQKVLNYIKILGPTIAIALGSIDYVKAIVASEEDNMRKTQAKFIKRIVAAMALFFIPLIVQILLGLFGITGTDATGGLS